MPYCYPPDPNTRKPKFTPPPNACDTHFHVFGPPEVFPFLSTHEYTPPAAPLEHYQKMLAVIGIERAVVVQPSVHGLDNSATLDAIKNSRGKFRGVGRIDDKTPKDELQTLARRRHSRRAVQSARPAARQHQARRARPLRREYRRTRLVRRPAYRYEKFDRRKKSAFATCPVPVVIDHIARVKPAEGLHQAGLSAAARI